MAQSREDGVPLDQIARDFGIHPMTLQKWIRKADVEAEIKPGTTSTVVNSCARPSGACGCWSKRTRCYAGLLRTCPRRTCREKVVPGTRASWPLTPVPVAVACRVLKIARQPYYRSLKNPITDAGLAEAYRANALFDADREGPEFRLPLPRR